MAEDSRHAAEETPLVGVSSHGRHGDVWSAARGGGSGGSGCVCRVIE